MHPFYYAEMLECTTSPGADSLNNVGHATHRDLYTDIRPCFPRREGQQQVLVSRLSLMAACHHVGRAFLVLSADTKS